MTKPLKRLAAGWLLLELLVAPVSQAADQAADPTAGVAAVDRLAPIEQVLVGATGETGTSQIDGAPADHAAPPQVDAAPEPERIVLAEPIEGRDLCDAPAGPVPAACVRATESRARALPPAGAASPELRLLAEQRLLPPQALASADARAAARILVERDSDVAEAVIASGMLTETPQPTPEPTPAPGTVSADAIAAIIEAIAGAQLLPPLRP